MKKLICFISIALSSLASADSSFNSSYHMPLKHSEAASKLDESFYHPYFGAGFSTFVFLPYGGNFSIGTRSAAPNMPVGVDISANYTATFASQYYFIKGMLPVYLNRSTPLESYYMGPYLCFGYNHISEFLGPNSIDFNSGPLLINGMAFGKNFLVEERMNFWQVSANFARLEGGSSLKWESWPTFTFQYGLGF